MLNSKEHIRVCLLYEFKLGHTPAEATRNICQAIGPGTINHSTVTRWWKRFSSGDESLKDEPRSGRPTTFNLADLKQAIEDDPTLTTANLASSLGCTQRNIQYHIKSLGFVSKLSGWCPHELDQRQLQQRFDMCHRLISSHRTFNWLDNLITGDEKWVLYSNIERKRHWLQPHETPPPTPKAGLHPQKECCLFGGTWTV